MAKNKIHSTAIIGTNVTIDPTTEVGPYTVIEDDVIIGKNVKIWPHVFIGSGTRIGDENQIHTGAAIGDYPQDIAFKNTKTYVTIGRRNIIREYVTIHRGTKEGTVTEIGDDNFFMALSHIGHNCIIGNRIIIVNGAVLGGYVVVEDQAFLSGNVAVHQFCRIGKLAIIGGFAGVNKDVPPYMAVRGESRIRSINLVGLRRAGINRAVISEIKNAFRVIYRSGLNVSNAIKKLEENGPCEEIRYLIDFIKKSKRGISKYQPSKEGREDSN